jgi:hypothetical protein
MHYILFKEGIITIQDGVNSCKMIFKIIIKYYLMMINNNSHIKKSVLLICYFLLFITPVTAQVTWPQGQILPTFSATAQTQDLFVIKQASFGPMTRWEAEGLSISHDIGHVSGDGWLCQSAIDSPNNYMVKGPYVKNVPAGLNTAEFSMMINNNTINNDAVAIIDVRNATTGEVLAKRTITRKQFPLPAKYTNFRLDYIMPVANQSLELRVYWLGNSSIKVDWVGTQVNNDYSRYNYLFASLKGIVNKKQPRIFSYDGDAFAEGTYTWLQSLGLKWRENSDIWSLITKYRSEIDGLIVYDPDQLDTVNLASMLASSRNALIVSPSLLSQLTSAPYNLPILMDLRGQFNNKLEVYQALYDNYWPDLDHRLLVGLSPTFHEASLREYVVSLGVATLWLDPLVPGESELLNSFLASMPSGSNYMGWWPQEGPGVDRASKYGVTTIASDYCTNLTVHSGMPRTINLKPVPPKPALENKIYVAFIISDGDNLSYVEHLMRKLWNNPDRGSVPIGWTVSPAMVDAMPGALNYYHETATVNDNLISGPSGYGYTYPNYWPDQNRLNEFVDKTENYNRRAGLQVITVWNGINGGINQNVGETYAKHAPSLLGITGQNTAGPLSIYNNSLPGFPLSCNYCAQENNVQDFIAQAAAGWNGNEPRFIIIQAQPWQDMKPSNFKSVANSLSADYKVVRPDHLFQLLRESKGLPIDPFPLSNTGIVTVYKDCDFLGFSRGLELGDYNLDRLKSLAVQDDDISSLKIAEGYKAILYQEDNFTGNSIIINSDTSCLNSTWNKKTSSIRVIFNGDTNLGGTTYYLQNRNSGLNMEVSGSSSSNGANVAQGTVTTGNNQKFTFTHLGDGIYKIIVKHSGLSLDINGFNKANGANLEQYPYNATPNQQFILVPTGDGYYKILAKHSGRLLEVYEGSTVNGANIQQFDNNNQTWGQWKLIPADSKLIQAEFYSTMNGILTEATSDLGGGLDVTSTDPGDLLTYNNINFPTTGSYLIEYRVASNIEGAKISTNLNAGSIQLGSINIPNTSGGQNWQTISQTVNISAGTYNFGLLIENGGVNINWINITRIGVGETLSVKTQEEIVSTLNIYPNPVEDTLFFSTDLTGINVSVFSPTGIFVSKQKLIDNSLDVSHLKAGVYFVIFDKDGNKIVKRFVKK